MHQFGEIFRGIFHHCQFVPNSSGIKITLNQSLLTQVCYKTQILAVSGRFWLFWAFIWLFVSEKAKKWAFYINATFKNQLEARK
jgi:hypothetical protein